MEPLKGVLASVLKFICFLPFFNGLLLLNTIKGFCFHIPAHLAIKLHLTFLGLILGHTEEIICISATLLSGFDRGVIVYVCDSSDVRDIYNTDGSRAISASEPLAVLVGVIPDHPLPTSFYKDEEGFCNCLHDPTTTCYVNKT